MPVGAFLLGGALKAAKPVAPLPATKVLTSYVPSYLRIATDFHCILIATHIIVSRTSNSPRDA